MNTTDRSEDQGAPDRVGSDSAIFPELAEVDKRTVKFWLRYLSHCLRYPVHFFTHAPASKWYTFFVSTHRVAWDCTRGELALEAQPDIWTRGALRGRFVRWADEKLNQPNSQGEPRSLEKSTPPQADSK